MNIIIKITFLLLIINIFLSNNNYDIVNHTYHKIINIKHNKSDGNFLKNSLLRKNKFIIKNMIIGISINPRYKKNLNSFIDFNYLNSKLKLSENEIKKYISFTRFTIGYDKLWCDWCSLTNGIVELICKEIKLNNDLDKIYNNKKFPNHIMNLMNLTIYLNNLPKNYFEPKKNDLNKLNFKNNNTLDIIIKIFKFRNYLEYIEQTWCPFKYLREINYNRKYYFYLPDNLKEVRYILLKNNRVTCNECNKIINNEKKYKNIKENSIFKDYLQEIIKIYNN